MLAENNNRVRAISAKLSPFELDSIEVYIKGVVDNFCKRFPKEKFSVRIFFGGDNKDWNGTPLQKIYDYYISIGLSYKKAFNKSAIDVGRLLKKLLIEDEQLYLYIKGYTNEYILIGYK